MTATIGLRPGGRAEPGGRVAVVTADGHSWSWTELFETFAPPIRSFARSRGVRTPDDVVQDVFVAAVEILDRFEGDRSGLRSLLFTIAYRRVSDEHRRLHRRPEVLVSTHAPTPDSGPAVEEVISSRDSVDRALRAFSVLDARERKVLEMRIFQEATPAQVAAVIGVSSGNVRVIQARALSKIRNHLESLRTEGAAPKMATGGLLFAAALGYLRSGLPSDGLLGQWIDDLRRVSAKMGGATAAISSGAALGGESALGSAVASVDSSAMAVSGTTKLTMIVALAAATIGSGVVVTASDAPAPTESVAPAESLVSIHRPDREVETIARESGPIPAPKDLVEILPAPSPTSEVRGQIEAEIGSRVDQPVPAEGEVEPDPVREAPIATVVDPVVEDVVMPVLRVVDGVVEPAVEEVVEPILREVDGVVDPVIEDVVVPVLGELDDVVAPLVDELAVPSRADGADELLDPQVESILRGLLGG